MLQETTSQWQDALAAAGTWPFESSRNLEANSDMKLFSRFPIVSATTISPKAPHTGRRFAIRYELLVGQRTVAVYAVHPQTPRSPTMWRERTAYLRDLAEALKSERGDTPVIIAGDWNTPPLYYPSSGGFCLLPVIGPPSPAGGRARPVSV
ncbi:endonuclease/exonuclease/phosphatase family protein (plasmid) [Mesorhizobium atlanticum]